jgi:hypothetical protein
VQKVAERQPSTQKELKEKVIGQSVPISSPTHPDEQAWYNNYSPVFSWKLPEGALEVKTLISKLASRNPTVPYAPPISEKVAEKLVDGTHYFSLQARTKDGWTPTSRFQVNVDTSAPLPFRIQIVNDARDKKIPPHIAFETTDQLSGISHYEVRLDNGEPMRTSSHDAKDPFAIPTLDPGGHVATVQAFDRAGNMTQTTLDFFVDAIPPPKIISAPSVVYGVHEESVSVGEDGSFVFPVARELPNGSYILSAFAQDKTSARSYETTPIIITRKPFYAASSFVVFTMLSFLLAVAIGATITMWYYTKRHGARVAKVALMRIRYAEQETEKAFDILREEIIDRVALLKAKKPKRKYTQEEVRFLETLESYLGEAKDVIVSDVRKVIDK